MNNPDACLGVYITIPTPEEAELLAKAIIEARVAACVNIHGGVKSYFHWNGHSQETLETAMWVKTTRQRLPELFSLIRHHHPYECPSIVALPLVDGHAPFLDWIRQATGTSPSP
jgi:periplasmic divalent cation tolerance protein